jgi:hypothetical protein
MARDSVIVQKSGELYLLGNRREAIAVDVEEGTTSDVLNTQSYLAHCHVNDPWLVIDDHSTLPQLVLDAIEAFRKH